MVTILESVETFKSSLSSIKGPDVKFQKLGLELPFHYHELNLTPESRIFREAVDQFGPHRNLVEIYNHWILNTLERQITTKSIVHDDIEITFQNVRVYKPDIFPFQARDTNKSYMSKIVVDTKDSYGNVTKDVPIGSFPCMVGSVLCNLHGLSDAQLISVFEDPIDPMGYFIIKGTERLVVTLERLRYSCFLTYVATDKEQYPETRITCTEGFNTYIVMMKYYQPYQYHGVILQNQDTQEKPINIYFLFRLFGWNHDRATQEILKYIPDDYKLRVKTDLTSSYYHDKLIDDLNLSLEASIKLIGMKKNIANKLVTVEEKLEKVKHDLFPNVSNISQKLELLAMMTSRQTLFICGYNNGDDRDSWSNKQLQTAGTSLEVDMNSILTSEIVNLYANEASGSTPQKKINHLNFTKKFLDTFNNNLGPQGKIGNRSNNIATSEPLRRDTPLTVYSLTTRINTPTDRQVKKASTRNVHGTQVGTVCIVQTPESIHCGLVKHAAVSEHTSLARPDDDAIELIRKSKNHDAKFREGWYPILVNGKPEGWGNFDLVKELNRAKRDQKLPFDSTCLLNGAWNTIEYFSNGGRVMYPVFVVEDNTLLFEFYGKQNLSFKELLKEGLIVYVDAREQEQRYNQVAESTAVVRKAKIEGNRLDKYTFSFIDGLALYGVNGSLVPFANMTIGPRAVFQTSMYNQALGVYHYNHMYRFDTSFKKLIGPTRSINESILSEVIGMNTFPTSQTAVMAIYADPYNYEDAVTINKQFVERNNMNYVVYSTHKITLRNDKDMKDYIVRPKMARNMNASRYDNLDANGYPKIGARIRKDDYIIGIVRIQGPGTLTINDDGSYTVPETITKTSNQSYPVGIGEEGYIDSYRVTTNSDKETIIRIKIAQYKMVNIGDKFSAAQTAQKGTCGFMIDSEKSLKIASGPNKGLSPQYIFNPHSLPSRMTINMILCMLLLRWAVYTGRRIDTTTHHQDPIKLVEEAVGDMYRYARARGLDEAEALQWAYGEEYCIGPNGKPIQDRIFICPCTEQLLRHLVDAKIQCRGIGPIRKSNHQPTQGRQNNGGQKTGEMERDAMAAHGAASALQERMRDVADLYETAMCANCGKFAIVNPHENRVTCMKCKDSVKPVKVKIPFSLKQTIQTVGGLQIDTTFELKPKS